MNLNAKITCAIFLMALCIYLLRILGFWCASYFVFNKNVKAWLDYLPGCILTAIIAPDMATAEPLKLAASMVVMLTMIKTKNIFLSLLLGLATISIRNII